MTTPPILSPTTYSHIGIFVEDLEEGVAVYSKLLNVRFRPPVVSPLTAFEQRGFRESAEAVRFAYSIDGPPYYELIEMTGTGLYARENNVPGFNHIAVWRDEAEMLREINREDSPISGIFWAPDGSPRACYRDPEGTGQIRLEYLNNSLRARFEHLWSTGKLPD